ncbi:hypothetical protein [Myxacorys almedinensis]|uniref:Uncharacterized protein n=1 Tax=Myxacorys almedinensis A TaxID=2690445 RepID=A0A8J7Z1J0_9CYAN|nr:hypothetical protein [Myxacorys almedinensis]NDJ18367.1 hypothetical protein [Myxacorys almedinensis A]
MLNFKQSSDQVIPLVDLRSRLLPSFLDSDLAGSDLLARRLALGQENFMMASPSDKSERLAPDSVDWIPPRNLKDRAAHLEDVTLDEAVHLLEEAVEVYTVLAPTLPTYQLERACDELEFLTNLCRQLTQATGSNL